MTPYVDLDFAFRVGLAACEKTVEPRDCQPSCGEDVATMPVPFKEPYPHEFPDVILGSAATPTGSGGLGIAGRDVTIRRGVQKRHQPDWILGHSKGRSRLFDGDF